MASNSMWDSDGCFTIPFESIFLACNEKTSNQLVYSKALANHPTVIGKISNSAFQQIHQKQYVPSSTVKRDAELMIIRLTLREIGDWLDQHLNRRPTDVIHINNACIHKVLFHDYGFYDEGEFLVTLTMLSVGKPSFTARFWDNGNYLPIT